MRRGHMGAYVVRLCVRACVCVRLLRMRVRQQPQYVCNRELTGQMDGWLLLAADDIFFAIDGVTTSFTCNVENILKSLVIILYSTLYLFFFHCIYILSRNFVILRKSRCLAVFSFESNLSYVHVNNVNRFPITKKIFMYFLSPLEKRKWKKEIKSKKVQLHGRQLLVYFTATARWFILSLSLSTSLPFFRSLSLFFFSPSPTCELLLSWFLPSL